MKFPVFISSLFFSILTLSAAELEEALPPLVDGNAPATHAELWADFDPRKEPLEVQVLHGWEEDGVVLRVVRYRVGVFKGKKSWMAGVFGYPKRASKLPGLVNIHGGGQYADYRSVITNAKRGYTTISIAWAGRISAPDYRVSPHEVKLFWEGDTDHPQYRVTTDWGALDAYHAPSKNGQDAFVSVPDGTQDWTLDSVASPRNISWFLIAMAARRALTFLEQAPQVDPNKLGVYGHSMGGKLTVATAGADSRVKAAAPSCGGISDRYNANPLHREVIGDAPALRNIKCPMVFLMPANDFHGHINNLVEATNELGGNEWRVVCSPHLNHRDSADAEVASQLWFDQHLTGEFSWPETPETSLQLKTDSGIPRFEIRPDGSRPIVSVDVYYTQQGKDDGDRVHHENRINRFWHSAKVTKVEDFWEAELPLYSTDLPMWVYAHVRYQLDRPVAGAGYYYGDYEANAFSLSSLLKIVSADELRAAEVKPTLKQSRVIEDFEDDWRKEWYTHKADSWEIRTHKIYHPMWKAPSGALIRLDVKSELPTTMVVGVDEFAAEIDLSGGAEWQTISLSLSELMDANGNALEMWDGIKELRLLPAEKLRAGKGAGQVTRDIGGEWKGAHPEFRRLIWVKE